MTSKERRSFEDLEFDRDRAPLFWIYLNKTLTADSEDDLDYLYRVMSPSDDREEMGEIYNEVLGYNPIEYFDERYLINAYEQAISDAPDSLKQELIDNKDEIIKKTMERKDFLNEDYLLRLLLETIKDETGWMRPGEIYSGSGDNSFIMDEFDILDDDDLFEEDDLDEEDFDDGDDDELDNFDFA